MNKVPVNLISLGLAGVIVLAPICGNPLGDLQWEKRTTTIFNLKPEPVFLCRETEFHFEELTFKDMFNVNGSSYAATGTYTAMVFGGKIIGL